MPKITRHINMPKNFSARKKKSFVMKGRMETVGKKKKNYYERYDKGSFPI